MFNLPRSLRHHDQLVRFRIHRFRFPPTWPGLFVVILCLFSAGDARAQDEVTDPLAGFKDENLRAAVQEACERVESRSEPLSEESLQKLRFLDLRGADVKSLAGLGACTELTQLYASDNSIADLQPLSACTQLHLLDVEGNSISNLSPVQTLTQLRILNISRNRIDDLSPLSTCGELRMLHATSNRISDLAPCAELSNLHALFVSGNQIAQPVLKSSMVRLATIDLRSNQIDDLSRIEPLPGIKWLFLSNNDIRDLSPLAEAIEKHLSNAQKVSWTGIVKADGNPLSRDSLAVVARLRSFGATISTISIDDAKSDDSEQSPESTKDEPKTSE